MGADLSFYEDYPVGSRVMTPEGFPGTVTESLPVAPGQFVCVVVLDDDQGGGNYGDYELLPLDGESNFQVRASVEAGFEVTSADVDYPELGSILSERLPMREEVDASEYHGGRVLASRTAGITPRDWEVGDAFLKRVSPEYKGLSDNAQRHALEEMLQSFYMTHGVANFGVSFADAYDHEDGLMKAVSLLKKAAVKRALYLPLANTEHADPMRADAPSPEGYAAGLHDGKKGVARNPANVTDGLYVASYQLGWARGVETAPPPLPAWQSTSPNDMGPFISSRQDEPPLVSEAGLWDFIRGNQNPSKNWQPGHNYSRHDWCFLPDAPVLMADGTEKPISQVQVGDSVISHLGNIRRVTWVGSKDYDGDTVRTSMSGDVRDLVATAEHRVFSANRDFGLVGAHRSVLAKAGVKRQHLEPESGWDQIQNLAVGDYVSRSILVDEQPFIFTAVREPSVAHKAGLLQEIKVDEDIAWLVGLYTGDGWQASRNLIHFSVHENQTDIVDRIVRISRDYFGVEPKIRHEDGGRRAYNVGIIHWALADLCVGLVGKGSAGKSLAAELLVMPLAEQASFVRGYVDSDGHDRADGGHNISTVSPHLARQVREILVRLGYTPTTRMNKDDGYANAKPSYRVEWFNAKNTLSRHFIRGGQVWQQITNVDHEHYSGEVWDIEVEVDHSFRAYGYNVHNCRFRRDSRCMYPSGLDAEGSKEAGYPVFTPVDRGFCPRDTAELQKKCPVSYPGQDQPGGLLNATVPWSEGGQRLPESWK
jgi:hypothetical protein